MGRICKLISETISYVLQPDDFNEMAAATQWWYRPYHVEDEDNIIKFVFPSPQIISWLLCWSVALIINLLVWPASLYLALGEYVLCLQNIISLKTISKYSPLHEGPSK